MRLKKGSKVEILNTSEVPLGSWWCAEIISGNGHTYYVKYDLFSHDVGAIMERVPRKAIRPCPPSVEAPRTWVPGDIVEVFDNNSWKLVEVSRVVGSNNILVRLLGSSREFRAQSSDLRLRQSWQDNKWIVIQKHSRKRIHGMLKEQKFSSQMSQPSIEVKNSYGDDDFPIENDCGLDEPYWAFSRGMKKRPGFCSDLVEKCAGAGRKMRALEKEGRHQQHFVPEHSPQSLEKVDAVASPQTMVGEKYTHASLNNKQLASLNWT